MNGAGVRARSFLHAFYERRGSPLSAPRGELLQTVGGRTEVEVTVGFGNGDEGA